MRIEYQPIGVVHSPFTEIEGMPIQPSRARGVSGTVEVFPEYVEGLADLEGFSYFILLCHLHRSRGFRLAVWSGEGDVHKKLRNLFRISQGSVPGMGVLFQARKSTCIFASQW